MKKDYSELKYWELPLDNVVSTAFYSERGLMTYLTNFYLPKEWESFLREAIMYSEESLYDVIFKDTNSSMVNRVVLFNELDFGKRDGFGCPDGAIYIEINEGRGIWIFIDAKLDSYLQSIKAAKVGEPGYNSTIKGQMELKWRMLLGIEEYKKNGGLFILDVGKEFYAHKDIFYNRDSHRNLCRRLRVEGTIKDIFNKMWTKTDFDDFYFVAAVGSNKSIEFPAKEDMPTFFNIDGSEANDFSQRFALYSIDKIINLLKL